MYGQPGFGAWVLTTFNSELRFWVRVKEFNSFDSEETAHKEFTCRSFVKEINNFYSGKEKIEIRFLLEFIKKN
jgi:hypothetical protein